MTDDHEMINVTLLGNVTFKVYTLQPLYNTVRYNTVLDITLFKGGSQKCIDYIEQEAHGPRFTHLSDIATADMQMLCNIFPILSSQLMKISSFEQFLVLKKNI